MPKTSKSNAKVKSTGTKQDKIVTPKSRTSACINFPSPDRYAAKAARVIIRIEEIAEKSSMSKALEIGRFLLDEYFGGSVQKYKQRVKKADSASNIQFDYLLSLPKLQAIGLSPVTLRNYIKVAGYYPDYPKGIRENLPLGIQQELARITNKQKRLALAKRAVEENWTFRKAKQIISGENENHRGGETTNREFDLDSIDKMMLRIWDKLISTQNEQLLSEALGRITLLNKQLQGGQQVLLHSSPIILKSQPPKNKLPIPFSYFGGKSKVCNYLIDCIKSYYEKTGKDWKLCEVFAGGFSVSQAALADGFVDKVWLNDRDPLNQAFVNSIYYDHERLIEAVLAVEVTHETLRDKRLALKTGLYDSWYYDESHVYDEVVSRLIMWECNIMSKPEGITWQEGDPSRWNPERVANSIEKLHYMLQGHIDGREISGRDFRDILLGDAMKGNQDLFLYLDPPYIRSKYRQYKHNLTDEDHKTLASILNKVKAPWLMTIDDHPMVAYLYHLNHRVEWIKNRGEYWICSGLHESILDPILKYAQISEESPESGVA